MAPSPTTPKIDPNASPAPHPEMDRSHHLNRTLYHCAETASVRLNRQRVCVATSGGKDATVCLDILSTRHDSLSGYFLYFVPDLEFQENYLSYLEKKYSFSIMRLPHPDLATVYRSSDYRHPNAKTAGVKKFTIKDIENYVRAKTGVQWFAAGEKVSDSMERNAMIRQHGGIDPKRKRFYPIAYWNDRQVFGYLKEHHIALPSDYRLFANNFGGVNRRSRSFAVFAVDHLVALRDKYPNDYVKILRSFPLLEASVFKYEQEILSGKIADERAAHG